jgi:hypothetical protein
MLSITSKTLYVTPEEAKEVKFAYNDPSRPFFSFVFLASNIHSPPPPELIDQHRSKLALQAINVVAADSQDQVSLIVRPKRKRKGTGVIVIDGSESEGEEEGDGSQSDDSETERMVARMADLEVSQRVLLYSKDTANLTAKAAIS